MRDEFEKWIRNFLSYYEFPDWGFKLTQYLYEICIKYFKPKTPEDEETIATVCLCLTLKMWEDDSPNISVLYWNTKYVTSQKQLIKAEARVLRVLDYNLLKATKNCFGDDF